MKKRALNKDFRQEIKKSMNRFVSILLIVAMGVAFFSGIWSAAPDMRVTEDAYFDGAALMDIRVISTMGLTKDDLAAISAVEGVEAVEGVYMEDVYVGGDEAQAVLRIESFANTMNAVAVAEGALPVAVTECFLDEDYATDAGLCVGDTLAVTVNDEDDTTLTVYEFTIAGIGYSPCYIAFQRGSTTLGTGSLSGFVYVLPEAFDVDYYSIAYVQVEGAMDLQAYTEEYDELVAEVLDRIEAIEELRCEIRYDEIMEEAKSELEDAKQKVEEGESELEDAKQELEDAKAEAESELAEAESELLQGESELADGKQELEDAKQKVIDGESELAEGESELAASETTLANAKSTLNSSYATLLSGETEYKDGLAQYESESETATAKLVAAQAEVDAGQSEVDAGWEEYNSGMTQVEEGEAQIAQAESEIAAGWESYNSGKAELETSESEYEAGLAELTEGKTALASAKAEVEEARASYDSGRAQLDAAWEQYNAGVAELAASQSEYDTATAQVEELRTAYNTATAAVASLQTACETAQATVSQLEAALAAATEEEQETIAAQLAEAQAAAASLATQLATAQATVESLSAQLSTAESSLSAAKTQIDTATATLASTKSQLDAQEAEMATAKAQVEAAEAEIASQEATIASTEATLASAKEQIEAGKAELAASYTQLTEAEAEVKANKKTIKSTKKTLKEAKKTLTASEKELAAAQKEIDEGYEALKTAKAELTSARSELDSGWSSYYSGLSEYNEGLAKYQEGVAELEEARQKLEDARQEIADAEETIAENEQKLEDGWAEYEDGKAEFDEKIAEAEQKIADAEEEIEDAKKKIADAEETLADLSEPDWYVYDRSSLPDNAGYGENADRMENIATVFPLLFFLVAALISLTTMTRMVEEERTQIGTLKALGYGKWDIAKKYIKYAFWATILGSILGVLSGEKLLPYIIINAYGIAYAYVPAVLMPYNWEYGLIASGLALLCTIGATLSACYRALGTVPAQLMRPPAPKEGKRVLLERIPFLWNRLNFTWKSTVRNLLRYKKRFLMTVIGIGGCMGLLLVGYGLRDSIMDVGVLQYDELQTYDAMLVLNTDKGEDAIAELEALVSTDARITAWEYFYIQSYDISGRDASGTGKQWSVYLYVPKDTANLNAFLTFRSRTTDEVYELTDEGCILTEKIAKEYGLSAGDVISLSVDDRVVEIPVAAVCENYLSHYMYLSTAAYEKYFGEEIEYNAIFYCSDESDEVIEDIGTTLIGTDAGLNITYTASLAEQIEDMLGALDIVIVVLIISAGLLAFVVLYNLNNININERKRELATLKVLGFYNGEVSAYVYRENILLTVIGALAGCGIGKIMHSFIITTVEVDSCMFGRDIYLPSYIYGTLFTFAFSIIVNVAMHFKLKKIDMIESLKSIE